MVTDIERSDCDRRVIRRALPARLVGVATTRLVLVLALTLTLAAGSAAGQSEIGTAVWLDGPPRPWNAPGLPVPARPVVSAPGMEGCRDQERSPENAEETLLAQNGWRLLASWPTRRDGERVLVTATAGYDGMCRPVAFNVFGFAGGQFAGTLSPGPMIARTDGVLSAGGPTFRADGHIEAAFIRYAPNDPSCCPSLPDSRVIYRIETTPGGPVVVPVEIIAGRAPLPRSGGVTTRLALLAAGVALLTGGILRRVGSSRSRSAPEGLQ